MTTYCPSKAEPLMLRRELTHDLSSVVPAKAGTHNHRPRFYEGVFRSAPRGAAAHESLLSQGRPIIYISPLLHQRVARGREFLKFARRAAGVRRPALGAGLQCLMVFR